MTLWYRSYRHRLAIVSALLTLASLSGCGRGPIPTYKVKATLKYQGTEETVPGARIELRPQDPIDAAHRVSPVGRVHEDGSIQMTTFEPGDGVPAGHYLVVVGEPPKPHGWDVDQQGMPPRKIPQKYKSYETSDLTLEVRAKGNNLLEIELEHP
jgi:predicted small lipoprotein YifL